jgi:FAD/FMN-containing dehydrogenase
MTRYASWGNYPQALREEARVLTWRDELVPEIGTGRTVLPRGLGRSYGDSCLNDGGVLLDATRLDHFIELDEEAGLLRCEAGVALAAVLSLVVPRGFFLPVSPGTKFVTVAGAVANDIHGKNHHRAGTFGRHVTRFELLRSDGRRLVCSPEENPGLYRATIGGLGLTGLITWVEFRLKRVPSELIDCETVRFSGLDEFFDLAAESDERFEYTVAWTDCLARGSALGRGRFIRGNHAPATARRSPARPPRARNLPVYAPSFLLHRFGIRAFNTLYYHRQWARTERRRIHYDPFFYPLDSIGNWNRLYGRRGFLQYQFVVPHAAEREGLREIFRSIAQAGEASFLAVLKVFGDVPSPGLLSFPRPGVTLALDFPNRGRRTLDLLEELDRIVAREGGRVYPAKDARMSARSFQRYFPEWRELSTWIDPRFSSSFWRRVTEEAPSS